MKIGIENYFHFSQKRLTKMWKYHRSFAKIDFGENTKTPLFARINALGNTAFLRFMKIDFACNLYTLILVTLMGSSQEKMLWKANR
jgi:hypothetical protein